MAQTQGDRQIQERRTGKLKAPARKNLNEDFPLRGFVLCSDCGEPLTACWSAGRRKKYPYYLCDTKGCASYRKSIRRQDVESGFDIILKRLNPSPNLIDLVIAMFSMPGRSADTKPKT
ncbi:MAG: zinc ribbon domain-containing protein [Filomicrobium sp.]